jgi:hypothetical protein
MEGIVHSFQTDLKRALTSWGFWAAAAGMVIAVAIGGFQDFLNIGKSGITMPVGFHETALLGALSSDTVLLVVPILCALPFTASFVDDVKSGYIKFYLQRSGKGAYVAARAAATALSGGLALFAGIAISYLLFLLLFSPAETLPAQAAGGVAAALPPSIFGDILARGMLFLLCGAFWSLIGQLFASCTMSKYVAYASPFIFYYVLVILSERYLKDVYVLNPQTWLDPAKVWPGGGWSAALFLAELIAAAGLLFAWAAERRLRND